MECTSPTQAGVFLLRACSVHDGRRRPPRDADAPRTPTVAAAVGNKETPLLAADVPMCADVVFVVTDYASAVAFFRRVLLLLCC